MSFGFSPSDVLALVNIVRRSYKGWRDACGEYTDITTSLGSLLDLVEQVQDETEDENSVLVRSSKDKDALRNILSSCNRTVRELNSIIDDFYTLGHGKSREKNWGDLQRNWHRFKFGNKDLNGLRSRLQQHVTMLSAHLTAAGVRSLTRVEWDIKALPDQIQKTVDGLAAEIRAGRREGSIMTTYDEDEKEVWRQFRRELIGEGMRSSIIHKFKPRIKNYLRTLAGDGLLEENVLQEHPGPHPTEQQSALDSDEASISDDTEDGVDSTLHVEDEQHEQPPLRDSGEDESNPEHVLQDAPHGNKGDSISHPVRRPDHQLLADDMLMADDDIHLSSNIATSRKEKYARAGINVAELACEIPQAKRTESIPYGSLPRWSSILAKGSTLCQTGSNEDSAIAAAVPKYNRHWNGKSAEYSYGRNYADDMEYPTPDGYRTKVCESSEQSGATRPSFARKATSSTVNDDGNDQDQWEPCVEEPGLAGGRGIWGGSPNPVKKKSSSTAKLEYGRKSVNKPDEDESESRRKKNEKSKSKRPLFQAWKVREDGSKHTSSNTVERREYLEEIEPSISSARTSSLRFRRHFEPFIVA